MSSNTIRVLAKVVAVSAVTAAGVGAFAAGADLGRRAQHEFESSADEK